MKTYGFLILPEFSSLCLSLAVEPLRAANHLSAKRCCKWRLLSVDGAPVRSASGFETAVDLSLKEACSDKGFDILFVIASYNYQRHATANVIKLLQTASTTTKVLAGMDAGPFVLAKAGLLDNHKATIHWEEADLLQENFLEIEVLDYRYVIDRNRLTCAGSTTTLDFMLEIIRTDFGKVLSQRVADHFVYYNERAGHIAQRYSNQDNHSLQSARIKKAKNLMQSHIEDPLAITQLANLVGISQRQLEREFKTHLGSSVLQHYLELRLYNARRLASETTMQISEIAIRTGFSSQAALSRAYKKHFGTSPTQDRNIPKLGSQQRSVKRFPNDKRVLSR